MRQLADSLPQSIQNNSVKFQYAYVLYYFGSNSLKIKDIIQKLVQQK